KIKFRNPICESRWGFVLGARKVQEARATILTKKIFQHAIGGKRCKVFLHFWYGAAHFHKD
ncbi:hypothetical protein ABFV51_25460, partial [Pseudomonas asgharzadehiana]|uniref:hypothetical protein n=1 Tax=Pseudomonas asgharzadehiana TaxID=2842349 RepID=UPI0034D584F4